jgi:hypothetical protein
VRRRTVLQALGALLALPWITASACAQNEGQIHTHKPADDAQDKPMAPEPAGADEVIGGVTFRELRISAWFPPEAWPYSVAVVVTDHSATDPAKREITMQQRDVRGQLVIPVSFEASHDISLKITWECNKVPGKGAVGGIDTRERNAAGGQVSQSISGLGRRRFEWSMSPRRR